MKVTLSFRCSALLRCVLRLAHQVLFPFHIHLYLDSPTPMSWPHPRSRRSLLESPNNRSELLRNQDDLHVTF